MANNNKKIIDDNFFDFDDLFNLILSESSIKKNLLYDKMTLWLYDEALENPVTNPKDDSYDIRKKRKPFTPVLQEAAARLDINDIYETIKEGITVFLTNPSTFASKLLFLLNNDNIFFKDLSDISTENKRDSTYLISYALIRIIKFSPKLIEYSHSETYNPFEDYTEDDSLIVSTIENNVDSKLKELSTALYNYHFCEAKTLIPFNDELLSLGNSYVIDKSFRFFSSSFSVDATSGSKSRKSLQELTTSTTKNILIVGEGGIGKTTFLLSYLKELNCSNFDIVPIYIKLSECSTNTDHRRIIINHIIDQISVRTSGCNIPSYSDVINALKQSGKKYILLLDGFNEITTLDSGEVRFSIANEINELQNIPQLRIILSSREVDFYGLALNEFNIIKATGVSSETIIKYLSTTYSDDFVEKINTKTELMELLHNPLFLLMFTHTASNENNFNFVPKNRGSILFQYFNSNRSFYTEMNKNIDPNQLLISAVITFVLDFLIPDIGFYMESNSIFSISEDIFEEIYSNCISSLKTEILFCSDEIRQHYSAPYDLKNVTKKIRSIDSNDIFLLICNGLNILSRDNENKVFFCHQYIRDYFASYYFIRQISLLNSVYKNQPKEISTINLSWGERLWDDTKIQITYEIIKYNNNIINENSLLDTLSLFRINRPIHLCSNFFEISNLLELLTLLYDNDLSFLDLSYIDLTRTSITGKNFSNTSINKQAKFNSTIIGHDTCVVEGHVDSVIKWQISDDERYILSISSDREIKVWNTATQKCIYTREKIPFCEHNLGINQIDSCGLYKNGTFALFLFFDSITNTNIAYSYDFGHDSFTEYFCNTPKSDFKLLIYNSNIDKIIAVTTSHYLTFECNSGQQPTLETDLSSDISHELSHNKYIDSNWNKRFCAYSLFSLEYNSILYCKTNNNAPELADTFDKDYDDFHLDENGYSDDYHYQERKDLLHEQFLETRDSMRFIDYYIYNVNTKEFRQLHLDCDINSEFSLYLVEDTTIDVIEKFTAISKDGNHIIINNRQDIYKYDIYSYDYTFKKICKLPYNYYPFSMKFGHLSNNDYLSLFDHNHVIQLNIATGDILLDNKFSTSTMTSDISITDNYVLENCSHGGDVNLIITNVYSGNSSTFSLSSYGQILEFIESNDGSKLYVLYNNGSVFTYNAKDLYLLNSYNYSYKQHLSKSCYDKERNSVFCECSKFHNYMYSKNNSIIKIDLDNHSKAIESLHTLPQISNIFVIPNSDYLLAFSENKIFLFNANTLELLSSEELSEYISYRTPEDIVFFDDEVYAIYADSYNDNSHSFGMLLPIEISDFMEIRIGSAIYIPIYELTENSPALFIKQLPYSSLCYIKTNEITDFYLEYYYNISNKMSPPNEDNKFYRSINNWSIVYLKVPANTDKLFFDDKNLEIREKDTMIFGGNRRTKHLLVEKDSIGYEYDVVSQEYNRLAFVNVSGLNYLLYSPYQHMIYSTMNKFRDINAISIKNNCVVNTEEPVPELLICNCNFFNPDLSNVDLKVLSSCGAILSSN